MLYDDQKQIVELVVGYIYKRRVATAGLNQLCHSIGVAGHQQCFAFVVPQYPPQQWWIAVVQQYRQAPCIGQWLYCFFGAHKIGGEYAVDTRIQQYSF